MSSLVRDTHKPEERRTGVIRSRRHAFIAVLVTGFALLSSLRRLLTHPHHENPWLIEAPPQFPKLLWPAIGFNILFICFALWIAAAFWKGATGKLESFLVGGLTVGFFFGISARFLSGPLSFDLRFISAASYLAAFVAAVTVIYRFRERGLV